jgi:hypothetical protein
LIKGRQAPDEEFFCIGIGVNPHWITDDQGKRRYEHDYIVHAFVPVTADLDEVIDLIVQDAARSDIFITPSRLTSKENRKKEYARADWMLADLDDEGEDGDKVSKLVELGGIVLASGTPGHGHLWLPLDVVIDGDVLDHLYMRLRRWLGSDPAASNPVGFGRMAGTRSHKSRVAVRYGGVANPVGLGWDGAAPLRRASLSELEALLPPLQTSEHQSRRDPPEEVRARIKPSKGLTKLLDAEERPVDCSDAFFAVAAQAYEDGLSLDDAVEVVEGYRWTPERFMHRLVGEVNRVWEKVEGEPDSVERRKRSHRRAGWKGEENPWGHHKLQALADLIDLERRLRRDGADALKDVCMQATRLVEMGLESDDIEQRLTTVGGEIGVQAEHVEAIFSEALENRPNRAQSRHQRDLVLISAAELDAEVRAAPSPVFLIKGIWAEDAYGIIGAQDKAGKTFMILDAAVSVSSGTDWLGRFPIEKPGTVVAFLGEGGKRKTHRRLVAIARSRGLDLADLDIQFCMRVPHLSDEWHLAQVAEYLAKYQPVLVIIDPMYLAVRGAKSAQLNDMGEYLEEIQLLVQEAESALMVVHHWNETGKGTGPERFSGAGSAEWGRVRISVSVQSRNDGEGDGGESVVTLSLAISGDETNDRDVWFRRRVWTDDPDDLASAMHYEIEAIDAPPQGGQEAEDLEDLMEQVSAVFAMQGDKRFTQEGAEGLLRDIQRRTSDKREVLRRLAAGGYLGDDRVGQAHGYFFKALYRRETTERESGRGGDDEDPVSSS